MPASHTILFWVAWLAPPILVSLGFRSPLLAAARAVAATLVGWLCLYQSTTLFWADKAANLPVDASDVKRSAAIPRGPEMAFVAVLGWVPPAVCAAVCLLVWLRVRSAIRFRRSRRAA